MNRRSKIPNEPLIIRYTSRGILPHIGMHKRGHLFYQESSYSHFWFLGLMLIGAIAIGFLPWYVEAAFGIELKYWIAGALVWGGICGAVPYWVRNAFGQTIITDPTNHTITIKKVNCAETIPWTDIIGLQVCYQEAPIRVGIAGYQLNLVWQESKGQIKRHCLLKHSVKSFVVSLGNKYSSWFQFKIMDVTENSQQAP